jgi:hypothetical protein
MTKLRDLFDLPERVNPGDFVLKLSDVVDHPDAALKDYVVSCLLATILPLKAMNLRDYERPVH